MEALLARVAYVARRRRWWFVAFWVVALVALGSFAGRAQEELSSGGFEVPGSESQRVIDFFEAQADEGAQPFTFLVDAPDAASAEARLREVVATAVRIEPRLHVEEESVPSADGTTVAAFGAAAVSQDDGLKLAERLKDEVQRTEGAERTFVLGASATYETMQRTVTSDLARAETLTLPVVAIVLVGLFGALVAASLPLLLTLVSVVVTTGLVYFVATQTEVSVFATTMISMIGIGVAVDYTMFVLARYREELAAGVSSEAAVVTALRSSGTAVVFSGLTVIVSLLSIWAVPVRAVQSMAGGAVLVVAVAVLAAATLLPALLHIAGRRVDRGRIRLRRRRAAVRPVGPSTFWTAWVARIMRRPLPWFLGGAAVLVVLTIPAFFMETKNTSLEQLPTTSDVRQGNELLTREITGPGQGRSGSLAVLVQPLDGRPALAAPARAAADELAAALARDPLVRQTAVEPAGQALVVRADLRVDPEGEAARNELVPRVREIVAGSSVSTLAQVDVGGVSAFAHDLDEEVGGDLIVVILLVVALAYVVLLVLLRSVLLPLKAVVLNLLSIGAAYGVIVAVFQWGWLDWTGYESLGAVNTLNPALILAITFGLSMDYEVFLLSRIRERYEAHGDNERAVAEGIASSARVITSAAAIMVAVFSAFVLTGVPTIKEIGVGLAVAIAVDATVTRLVLVPATMRLLGDWNWWLPSWLDRLLPHVAHETGRPAPAAVAAD